MNRYKAIWGYLQQKSLGKEANRLERDALKDPFLYEALEGLTAIEGDHERIVKELKKQMYCGRDKRKTFYTVISVVAALFVLSLAVWLLYIPEKQAALVLYTNEIRPAEEKKEDSVPVLGAGLSIDKDSMALPVESKKALLSHKYTTSPVSIKTEDSFTDSVMPAKQTDSVKHITFRAGRSLRSISAGPEFQTVKIVPDTIPGCRDFSSYLVDSLRYPLDAKTLGIEGEVVLSVHFNKRKRPSRIKVVRSLFPSCDREAIRLIGEYPGVWNVQVRDLNIHVVFSLKD